MAAVSDPRPVVLEVIGELTMLVREEGRTSEVLILTPALSEAMGNHDQAGEDGPFLAALWHIAESSPEHLVTGRLRRTNTLH